MASAINRIRDDFADNLLAAAWGASAVLGSATLAETGGELRMTLPSSTAGTHQALCQSGGTYTLTGDSFYINIDTMVATGVAATAFFDLFLSVGNVLRWTQTSGTLKAQTLVGGVTTDRYSVAWNAATYKYLRIGESGGNILFDSSTNGTTWTNRASVAAPFALLELIIRFGAECGNVASPGSFRLEDVNLILPALSSTWHDTTVEWPLLNRYRVVTLASTPAQGYIAVASECSRDANGWPDVLTTPRYFAGPMGSSTGGYNQLTEYATQAAAQAMAVNLPADNRWDLPEIVECRFIRLYHRSITGSAYILYEYYPRRLVQADDIEAETIRAINIGAGQVTADKIFVLNLGAIVADIGQLNIDTTGWLYQGTGTGDAPTTGLKIFNSGGIGKLSTYNATIEQVTFDTDGKFKWGAGAGEMDATGIRIDSVSAPDDIHAYAFTDGTSILGGLYGTTNAAGYGFILQNTAATIGASVVMNARRTSQADVTIELKNSSFDSSNKIKYTGASHEFSGRIDALAGANIGTATGATTGQISTSGSVGVGVAVSSTVRLLAKGSTTTSAGYALGAFDSAGATMFYVRNDSVGFLANTAWNYSSDISKKKNIRNLNKDIREFLLLEPKMFDYIGGPANRYGYIAQDVQAVIPELINTEDDGSLSMATTDLIPLFNHVLRRLIRILVQKGVIGPADIA